MFFFLRHLYELGINLNQDNISEIDAYCDILGLLYQLLLIFLFIADKLQYERQKGKDNLKDLEHTKNKEVSSTKVNHNLTFEYY